MKKVLLVLALVLVPSFSFASTDTEIRASIVQQLLSTFVVQVNSLDKIQALISQASDQSQFDVFKGLVAQQLSETTSQLATLLNPSQQSQLPNYGNVGNNTNNTPMPPTPQVINVTNISTIDIATVKFDSNKNITIKQLVFQVDDSYNPDGYTVAQIQASLRNYPTNGSDRTFSGVKSNGKITINVDASTGTSATLALIYGQQGTAKNQAGIEKGFRVVLVGSESVVLGEDGSRLPLSDMEFLTN